MEHRRPEGLELPALATCGLFENLPGNQQPATTLSDPSIEIHRGVGTQRRTCPTPVFQHSKHQTRTPKSPRTEVPRRHKERRTEAPDQTLGNFREVSLFGGSGDLVTTHYRAENPTYSPPNEPYTASPGYK